jgi:hypothetical protein
LGLMNHLTSQNVGQKILAQGATRRNQLFRASAMKNK